MKRSLLVLIGLLSSVSPSFAMLDDLLVEDGHGKILTVKNPEDFRVRNPQYQGLSALHNQRFPKMPIVRPYADGSFISAIFSASLHKARASWLIEDIHSQQLFNYTKVYSFVVQSMEDEKKDGVKRLHALKPHYFMHSDAPLQFQGKQFRSSLLWTAVPGALGFVEPELGGIQKVGLLSDFITTHPGMYNSMVVSPDNLHLRGIHHHISTDMTSLVAFIDDQGNNIAAITYHWLLNEADMEAFWDVLEKENSFRDLITTLEPIDNFKDLLGELKKYVGLTPRMDRIEADLQPTGHAAKIETTPERITVITDHNANASYQLKSNRFAVKVEQNIRVPYEITVEEGGKMAFGLLNTNKNGWYGEELVLTAGLHKGTFERTVPEGETATSVVFRNYHLGTPGQTIFTVNHPTMEVDGKAVETQLHTTGNSANVLRKKGPVKVTTDHSAEASYQLTSKGFSVVGGEKIRVSYEITVEEGGKMSLGFLNTNKNGWYGEELVLTAGPHKGIFERTVPEGETITSVVFRNYHLGTPGRTTFTIKDLKIEREVKL